jgi:hypothetical protein
MRLSCLTLLVAPLLCRHAIAFAPSRARHHGGAAAVASWMPSSSPLTPSATTRCRVAGDDDGGMQIPTEAVGAATDAGDAARDALRSGRSRLSVEIVVPE